MNHFLDAESLKDQAKLEQLIQDNPLNEAVKLLMRLKKPLRQEIKEKKDDGAIQNDVMKTYDESVQNELGDTVDEVGTGEMTKGQRMRLEKKLKEEQEHKKRMAAMKAKKKKTTTTRPKFDRSKLSSGFMNNAKAAKDEVQGWALDFENDSQNVVVAGSKPF